MHPPQGRCQRFGLLPHPIGVKPRHRLISPRFTLLLVRGFGLLALLVAAIGLYGVVDSLVTRQRRDIAIRMALGARPERITFNVLREGLMLGAAGSLLGLLGAYALRRFLAPLLAGVGSADVLSYGLVGLALLGVSLAAAQRPARAAAKTDLAQLLRAE